jgi:protoheme ferro-lyase
VTVTDTVGTSIFGLVSIPKEMKENQPTTIKIKNITIVGTGFFIDQAEILKDMELVISYQLSVISYQLSVVETC